METFKIQSNLNSDIKQFIRERMQPNELHRINWHGTYVGLIAQEELKKFNDSQKKFAEYIATQFFKELLDIEKEYSKALYSELGLYHDVMDFVKYNANKAMNNLGFDAIFEHEPVNSII